MHICDAMHASLSGGAPQPLAHWLCAGCAVTVTPAVAQSCRCRWLHGLHMLHCLHAVYLSASSSLVVAFLGGISLVL
jgi:hypothetical protein